MKSSSLVLLRDELWWRMLTATTTHHYRSFNTDCTQYYHCSAETNCHTESQTIPTLPTSQQSGSSNLIINSPMMVSIVAVCKSVGAKRHEEKIKSQKTILKINPTVHGSHWVLTTNTCTCSHSMTMIVAQDATVTPNNIFHDYHCSSRSTWSHKVSYSQWGGSYVTLWLPYILTNNEKTKKVSNPTVKPWLRHWYSQVILLKYRTHSNLRPLRL